MPQWQHHSHNFAINVTITCHNNIDTLRRSQSQHHNCIATYSLTITTSNIPGFPYVKTFHLNTYALLKGELIVVNITFEPQSVHARFWNTTLPSVPQPHLPWMTIANHKPWASSLPRTPRYSHKCYPLRLLPGTVACWLLLRRSKNQQWSTEIAKRKDCDNDPRQNYYL